MGNHLHGTEEQLELYALGRLPASQIVVLEEHLLACPECLALVERNEQWSVAVREALSAQPKTELPDNRFGFRWLQVGFAVAAMLAIGVVVVSRGRGPVVPVAYVQLAAVRGELISVVKQAREFDLTLLDAPAEMATFRVQVVDSGGTSEWDGTAARSGKGIEVQVKKALPAGNHFVRLYAPDGRMLHEYGLRVL